MVSTTERAIGSNQHKNTIFMQLNGDNFHRIISRFRSEITRYKLYTKLGIK